MPRARRHFIPVYVWHITHRCHKKEFLLKFAKDRRRWMHWLFEAKKRYGLVVLNYMITSNHIHLLVFDNDSSDAISKSMQLIAGRTAQESKRCLLGRSLSCNCYWAKWTPFTLYGLYRHEYGSCRSCVAPGGMGVLWIQWNSESQTKVHIDQYQPVNGLI